jgi:hypothetical protein
VQRLLLALPEEPDPGEICAAAALASAHGAQLAVCVIAGRPGTGLLPLQQRMTWILRRLLGEAAEAIPVFAVTGQPGDDVDSCAAAWGADLVRSGWKNR